MWTLAIDTAGATGTIALGDGSAVFSVALAGRSYSSQLVPAADTLFRQVGISLTDLSLLAVVNGPGSFTGIRVGLSVAKAWAQTTNAKLIAISRLALCAVSIDQQKTVRVALDAGRNEVFFGQYRANGLVVEHETLIKRDELLALPGPAPLFLFESSLAEALTAVHPTVCQLPNAVDALAFAVRAATAGDFADPLTLDANYLRRSDAELFSKLNLAEASGN